MYNWRRKIIKEILNLGRKKSTSIKPCIRILVCLTRQTLRRFTVVHEFTDLCMTSKGIENIFSILRSVFLWPFVWPKLIFKKQKRTRLDVSENRSDRNDRVENETCTRRGISKIILEPHYVFVRFYSFYSSCNYWKRSAGIIMIYVKTINACMNFAIARTSVSNNGKRRCCFHLLSFENVIDKNVR